MTTSQTSWVKNSREAVGQDQLGVRFLPETIYQDLLPHITNVTSRGRYYSFYPWFIRGVHLRSNKLKNFSLQSLIRRADCLLTLIGLYHYRILEDNNHNSHDSFVGAKKLSSVLNEMLDSQEITIISKYATLDDSSDRYFKNSFGGLGQYYFGPLRDAGILGYTSKGEIIYTEDRGLLIAEAFSESVNDEEFFNVLEKDWVSEKDLEQLLAFCPCQLSTNYEEQNALINFLFIRDELFQNHISAKRKDSLILILDFIKKTTELNIEIPLSDSGIHQFLSVVYTGAFSKEVFWNNSSQSSEIKLSWRQYYVSELLSYAIQSLFWAGLTKLVEDDELVSNSQAYEHWFVEKFATSINGFIGETFADALVEIEIKLPEIFETDNENHEINLIRRLRAVVKDKTLSDRKEKAVELAVKVLLTLAARWAVKEDENAFPVMFSKQQLNEYPINLANFLKFINREWSEMSLKNWLGWLARRWGIETHLMIALRKLQQGSPDTFKIFPSEEGLHVKEIIGNYTIEELLVPSFTSPRLRTTLQILWDLGVVSVENGFLHLTTIGENILEELGND